MAASINICQNTVGLLVIFSDIISDEQQNELISYLDKALKRIDKNQFATIETIFNNLLAKNDFEADSQYRHIIDTDNGSLAGFLYQPNFHTVINVKQLIEIEVAINISTYDILGQQIDSSGSFILSDALLSADHFHRLLDKDFPLVTRHLHLSLPFVSLQWLKFSSNFGQKHFESISMDDLSMEINNDQLFGQVFYQNFVDKVRQSMAHINIYDRLIPRDRAGTIAFDEPNLYILYGQHGEASLFGIRGFVVLINGGFSQFPSYWNLIRGLQIIDTCILTHFDYDVFPGIQTIIHRKTIPSSEDGRSCKPDIGALFVNQTQRIRFQSSPTSKRVSNNKLTVNLSQNIDQFFHDVKKLNIDTFDLIKNITTNKPAIEPINLYKKIAFGSLDLYVLHPTSLPTEDEKMLAAIQKIPIRDQQPSPLLIPLHHWYSSCSLLVWTPTGKSSKDTLVRILYTGACPQTLVFEALTRARHLDVLHEVPQQPTARVSTTKTSSSAHNLSKINSTIQKVKPSSTSTTIQSNTKVNDVNSKPTSTNQSTKPDKIRLPLATASSVKRSSLMKSSTELQANNRKSQISTSKSADLTHEKQNHEVDSVHSASEKTSSSSDLQNNYEKESTNSELSGDLQRPESILFTGDNEENFVESNAATPIDDLHCHRFSTDPMTISFVDGAPNTRNPFLDGPDNEREMEIIHHTITETNEHSLPLHEEIEPQGLPIDDEQKAKKVAIKKSSTSNTRLSATTISSTTQVRKSKPNTLTGSIFYVDVAFIPYHGNEHYVDSEFFRRVRARYYVLNAVEINRLTLESLIDGKQQWDTQEKHPVTLVPTYDGDTLRQFFVANKARLAELNITIIAASIRCNVQYDDDGSPAQRLRFTSES